MTLDLNAVLDDLFMYHAPSEEQAMKYGRINDACREAARVILSECPDTPDRSAAVRLLREARMTANASIATRTGGLIQRDA